MTKLTVKYSKFPAKRKNFVGSDRLWTAPDHLLIVSSTGISESYKRFYFRDIQALNTVKTLSNYVKLWVTGAVFVLLCILATFSMTDPDSGGIGAIMALIVGLPVMYYIIRLALEGASCRCYIYSSVQEEKLAPIDTIKKANRLYDFLIPEIEKCQGTVTPGEIAVFEKRSAIPGQDTGRPVTSSQLKTISLVWHKILFVGLIVFAVIKLSVLLFNSVPLLLFLGLASFVTIALSVVAVAKQAGSRLSSGLKSVSIAALAFLIINLIVGYIEYVFLFIKFPEKMLAVSNNQWELMKMLAQINPFDYPVILGGDLFFIISFVLMGLAGYMLCPRTDR